MARETKVGLIVGLGVILFVSVFVSDYLSVPEQAEAISGQQLPNFVDQTTNQPEFILTREEETTPAVSVSNPRDLAAVSLESIEQRQGPPVVVIAPEPINTPPFREASTLTGAIDDSTPVAQSPIAALPTTPVGLTPIDDTHLAQGHQLSPVRTGPGPGSLPDLSHVELPEPQLINAKPVTIEHTVASGETLTSIARKHYDGDGNMWRSIRDANPGKVGTNGEIVQGITLLIPKRSPQTQDPAEQLVERSGPNSNKPTKQRVRMITVKEGETLSELAYEHLGSSGKWQLIMDVNTDVLEKPEQLRAGMKLRIPAEQTVQVVEEANAALTVDPAPLPDVRSDVADNARTYVVQEGDNLYRIAQKMLGDGERYQDIYKANKDKLRSANDIRVGMKLTLPAP